MSFHPKADQSLIEPLRWCRICIESICRKEMVKNWTLTAYLFLPREAPQSVTSPWQKDSWFKKLSCFLPLPGCLSGNYYPDIVFPTDIFCSSLLNILRCSHVIMWARLSIAESSVWWQPLNIYTTCQTRQLFSDISVSKGKRSPKIHPFIHSNIVTWLSCERYSAGLPKSQLTHSPALKGLTVHSNGWWVAQGEILQGHMEPDHKCDGYSEM